MIKNGKKVEWNPSDRQYEYYRSGVGLINEGIGNKIVLDFGSEKAPSVKVSINSDIAVLDIPKLPVRKSEEFSYSQSFKYTVSKIIHQTVNYVNKQGESVASSVHDQVTFVHTGTIDQVTGKITYTDWQAPQK